MTVVTTFELDDFISSCVSAGQTNGAHAGFGAAVYQAYHIDARHFADGFRQLDFQLGWRAEAHGSRGLHLYGFNYFWKTVTENHGSPGVDKVDVSVVVFVEHIRTFRSREEDWVSAYRLECADRRVYSSRNVFPGTFKELFAVLSFLWMKHECSFVVRL